MNRMLCSLLLCSLLLVLGGCSGQSDPELKRLVLRVDSLARAITVLAAGGNGVRSGPRNLTVTMENAPALGSPSAPLVMVEFTDYQCPFCRRYKQTTFPWLRENYVDRGHLRYVVRDLPLPFHNSARIAAVAARCVAGLAPDRFWDFHQAIFQADSGFLPTRLRTLAAGAGVSSASFSQCLADSAYTVPVSRDLNDATKAGLQATPSFIIGTVLGDSVHGIVIQGALPDRVFSGIIDSLLATRSNFVSSAYQGGQ